MEDKALQVGAAVLTLALLLRLGGTWSRGQEELGRTLLFLSSGRLVTETLPSETEADPGPVPAEPVEEAAAVPVFGESEESFVQVNAAWEVDVLPLLEEPLQWNLRADAPTVLILHSHATESYTKSKGESYKESSDYRTLNENYNMLSIGAYLEEKLKEGGLGVVHAKDLHDYPSYSGSYVNSRKTVQAYLKKYPTIQLVLDLHRDAADDGFGGQMDTSATVDGKESARLMMVVGTNAGGMNHPNWEDNLALAMKLHVVLEKRFPGLCRTISFRKQRFNQDLSPGALLIEVGAAGNTHAEALVAADALARGILELARGSATSDSAG